MNRQNFTVVVIDDDLNFSESLTALLRIGGFITEHFSSVEAAINGAGQSEKLFMTILDHDFSVGSQTGLVGYEFSNFLKKNHWAGKVMPIIYLTGRESKEGFEQAISTFGGYAPDEYIPKSKLASDPGYLETRIDLYLDRLYNFEASVDEHGINIAIGQFTDWID